MDNHRKRNTDKRYLLLSKNDETRLDPGDSLIKTSTSEKILRVKIGNRISFDEHTKSICKNANSKLSALARVTPYMGTGKRKFILNA